MADHRVAVDQHVAKSHHPAQEIGLRPLQPPSLRQDRHVHIAVLAGCAPRAATKRVGRHDVGTHSRQSAPEHLFQIRGSHACLMYLEGESPLRVLLSGKKSCHLRCTGSRCHPSGVVSTWRRRGNHGGRSPVGDSTMDWR